MADQHEEVLGVIREAHAQHDPHGFKNHGQDHSKLHSFPEVPYTHEEFPQAVYRGKHTRIVHNEEELKAAQDEDFSVELPSREEAEPKPEVEPVPVVVVAPVEPPPQE